MLNSNVNPHDIMLQGLKQELKEIYDSRNILRSLIVKELVGKYKNSALGFAWHFVVPAVMLAIYYIVFSQIRVKPIPDFWVYLASGLFLFHFMQRNLTAGCSYITGNPGMVKKMYVPREILVLSKVLSSFIIMIISYAVVFIVMIFAGIDLNAWCLMMIPISIMSLIFVFGFSLIFSSITVYVRDIQHLISSIAMMFFFMTPIYFMMSDISGLLHTIVLINPFSYFVLASHDAMYYGTVDAGLIASCLVLSTMTLVVGMLVFNRLKSGFAERL